MTIRWKLLPACCLAVLLSGLTGGCKSGTPTPQTQPEGKTGTIEMNPGAGRVNPQPDGVQPKGKHELGGVRVE